LISSPPFLCAGALRRSEAVCFSRRTSDPLVVVAAAVLVAVLVLVLVVEYELCIPHVQTSLHLFHCPLSCVQARCVALKRFASRDGPRILPLSFCPSATCTLSPTKSKLLRNDRNFPLCRRVVSRSSGSLLATGHGSFSNSSSSSSSSTSSTSTIV